MLRCRPTEIVLTPQEVAYTKRRLTARQLEAQRTQLIVEQGLRVRRGAERSRDDAVVEAFGYLHNSSNPRRDSAVFTSSLPTNVDGAAESRMFHRRPLNLPSVRPESSRLHLHVPPRETSGDSASTRSSWEAQHEQLERPLQRLRTRHIPTPAEHGLSSSIDSSYVPENRSRTFVSSSPESGSDHSAVDDSPLTNIRVRRGLPTGGSGYLHSSPLMQSSFRSPVRDTRHAFSSPIRPSNPSQLRHPRPTSGMPSLRPPPGVLRSVRNGASASSVDRSATRRSAATTSSSSASESSRASSGRIALLDAMRNRPSPLDELIQTVEGLDAPEYQLQHSQTWHHLSQSQTVMQSGRTTRHTSSSEHLASLPDHPSRTPVSDRTSSPLPSQFGEAAMGSPSPLRASIMPAVMPTTPAHPPTVPRTPYSRRIPVYRSPSTPDTRSTPSLLRNTPTAAVPAPASAIRNSASGPFHVPSTPALSPVHPDRTSPSLPTREYNLPRTTSLVHLHNQPLLSPTQPSPFILPPPLIPPRRPVPTRPVRSMPIQESSPIDLPRATSTALLFTPPRLSHMSLSLPPAAGHQPHPFPPLQYQAIETSRASPPRNLALPPRPPGMAVGRNTTAPYFPPTTPNARTREAMQTPSQPAQTPFSLRSIHADPSDDQENVDILETHREELEREREVYLQRRDTGGEGGVLDETPPALGRVERWMSRGE